MLASFEKRIKAFSIDTSGTVLLVFITLGFPFDPDINGLFAVAFFVFGFFGFYFFSNGQSFGKRMQKIKIVRADGEKASIIRILAREIFKVGLSVATIGVYLLVSGLLFNEKKGKKALHDHLFRTKVIDLSQKEFGDDYMKKTASVHKSIRGTSYDD